MTDILRKDITTEVVVPGQAGDPGTPPTPAYCVDTVSTTPTYEYWIFTDDDGVTHIWPVSGPNVTTTTHTCFPGSPGTPATPGVPPVVAVKYNEGWSGAARSIAELDGDGIYKFSVDQSAVGVISGFNSANEGAGYIEIEHGIYCHSGVYQVVENGTPKTSAASFSSSDVFAIRRLGNEVAYFKGTTKIYTSELPSSGTIFVDVSMYFGGDTLTDPSLSDTVGSDFAASGSGAGAVSQGITAKLRGLTGFAADDTVDGGVGSGGSGGSGAGAGGGDSEETGVGGGSGGPNSTENGDYIGRTGGELRGLVGVAESYVDGSVDTGGGSGSGGTGAQPNGDFVGRSGNQLRGLVGESYGSMNGDGMLYAICAGNLTPLDTDLAAGSSPPNATGGELQPQFAVVNAALQPIQGFSIALAGMVGTVEGKLGQLHSFASGNGFGDGGGVDSDDPDETTGEGGGAGGDNGTGSGDWAGRSGGQLRGLIGFSYDSTASPHAYAFLTHRGRYNLFAFGHSPTIFDPEGNPTGYGFHRELSGYSLAAYGGATADGDLPMPTLSASGTTTVLAQAELELSGYELDASGTTTILGRFAGSYRKNRYSVTAYGGGRMVAAHSGDYGLTASGTGDRLARATVTLPRPTLTASGTVGATGGVTATLPGLVPGNTAVFIGTLSGYTINAAGRSTVTVEYEAYSITLLPTEDGLNTATTHYTNFPFDRIVRFGSKHYGVAADGLYELGGDTFDGDPIVAAVETAQSDFEAKALKRPVGLYVSGTFGEDLEVSCRTDDAIVNSRAFTSRVQHGAAARRVKFGLGTTGHQLAFRFTNTDGENFEIEDFVPEVSVLRRLV